MDLLEYKPEGDELKKDLLRESLIGGFSTDVNEIIKKPDLEKILREMYLAFRNREKSIFGDNLFYRSYLSTDYTLITEDLIKFLLNCDFDTTKIFNLEIVKQSFKSIIIYLQKNLYFLENHPLNNKGVLFSNINESLCNYKEPPIKIFFIEFQKLSINLSKFMLQFTYFVDFFPDNFKDFLGLDGVFSEEDSIRLEKTYLNLMKVRGNSIDKKDIDNISIEGRDFEIDGESNLLKVSISILNYLDNSEFKDVLSNEVREYFTQNILLLGFLFYYINLGEFDLKLESIAISKKINFSDCFSVSGEVNIELLKKLVDGNNFYTNIFICFLMISNLSLERFDKVETELDSFGIKVLNIRFGIEIDKKTFIQFNKSKVKEEIFELEGEKQIFIGRLVLNNMALFYERGGEIRFSELYNLLLELYDEDSQRIYKIGVFLSNEVMKKQDEENLIFIITNGFEELDFIINFSNPLFVCLKKLVEIGIDIELLKTINKEKIKYIRDNSLTDQNKIEKIINAETIDCFQHNIAEIGGNNAENQMEYGVLDKKSDLDTVPKDISYYKAEIKKVFGEDFEEYFELGDDINRVKIILKIGGALVNQGEKDSFILFLYYGPSLEYLTSIYRVIDFFVARGVKTGFLEGILSIENLDGTRIDLLFKKFKGIDLSGLHLNGPFSLLIIEFLKSGNENILNNYLELIKGKEKIEFSNKNDEILFRIIEEQNEEKIKELSQCIQKLLSSFLEGFHPARLTSTKNDDSGKGSGQYSRRLIRFIWKLEIIPGESDLDYLNRIKFVNWKTLLDRASFSSEPKVLIIIDCFEDRSYSFFDSLKTFSHIISKIPINSREDLSNIKRVYEEELKILNKAFSDKFSGGE